MPYELSAPEARILGCLLEKERLTPENYPLSLNALTSACNQSTNRDPVTEYDEKLVEEGLNALREKKLATMVFGAGSRVPKYRHRLLDDYQLSPAEVALICVLLLRGPQTPGELRTRAERMHAFGSVEAVQARLDELAKDNSPLVRMLEPRPGQKERRYVQLLSAEIPLTEQAAEPALRVAPRAPAVAPADARLMAIEEELRALKTELLMLREEFTAFRKQFE